MVWDVLPGCSNTDIYGWSEPLTIDVDNWHPRFDRPLWYYTLPQKGGLIFYEHTRDSHLVSGLIFMNRCNRTSSESFNSFSQGNSHKFLRFFRVEKDRLSGSGEKITRQSYATVRGWRNIAIRVLFAPDSNTIGHIANPPTNSPFEISIRTYRYRRYRCHFVTPLPIERNKVSIGTWTFYCRDINEPGNIYHGARRNFSAGTIWIYNPPNIQTTITIPLLLRWTHRRLLRAIYNRARYAPCAMALDDNGARAAFLKSPRKSTRKTISLGNFSFFHRSFPLSRCDV